MNSFGLIVFIFLAAVSRSEAIEGSLAFQGGVAQAFQGNGKTLDPNFGFNGFAYFDLKLMPSISLGLGTSISSFSDNTKRLYLDGTHLLGRFTPFASSSWTPYLMAGVGFRPLYDIDPNHRWWQGDFQALAGLGVRHPLFNGIDLDLTAFYDINGPSNNPLSSLGARAGLAFPFGGDDSANTTVKKTSPDAQASAYQVHKGDTLWGIGRKTAGKGATWKYLYDANKNSIQNPNLIYPQQDIVLPKGF